MNHLIAILQQNAKTPHEDIARQLDLSVEEVASRIAELEKNGTILGYRAIVNREKLEPDTVVAEIEVKITPERDGGFDRVAQRIARFDEVKSCYLMSGAYDLQIVVEAPSLRAVATFVAEKLSTIEAVQSTATLFRLKTYKEKGVFFTLEPSPTRLSVTP